MQVSQQLDGPHRHGDGGPVVAEEGSNAHYAEHGDLPLEPGLMQQPGHRLIVIESRVKNND